MELDAYLRDVLDARAAAGLLRAPREVRPVSGGYVEIEGRRLLSFASNDYLGLAQSPALASALARGAAERSGAGSSRVVAGTNPVHRQAERALAGLVGASDARLFSSAYAANLAVLGSLWGPEDVLFSDALNHASIVDGCRLSGARVVIFPHGRLDVLEALLDEHAPRARMCVVVTESLFSMDGDAADLRTLRAMTARRRAVLLVDEAHALGVVGPQGRGAAAAHDVRPDIVVGGLGKSMGLAGGFVAGSEALGSVLDNLGRPYVFSTAILPAMAHAVPHAVELLKQAEADRARIASHAGRIRDAVRAAGAPMTGGPPAVIVSVVLGAPDRATDIARRLLDLGYLVPAMRPPTVPAGTSRLRITPTAIHTEEQVEGLCTALRSALTS